MINILKDLGEDFNNTKTGTDDNDDSSAEEVVEESLLDKDNCKGLFHVIQFFMIFYSADCGREPNVKQLCLLYETRSLQRGI